MNAQVVGELTGAVVLMVLLWIGYVSWWLRTFGGEA